MNDGITRNTDGTFLVRVSYVDRATGKRKFRQATYTRDRWRDRFRLRTELQNSLVSDTEERIPGIALAEYIELWLGWCRDTGKHRAHVSARYREDLQVWVLPYIGEARINSINHLTLVAWSRDIAAKRKTDGSDYSKATRAKVWRILRSCLQAAPYIIGEEISIGKFRFAATGEANKPKQWLDREGLAKLIQAVDGYHLIKPKTMLLLLWSTGMRLGEATALTWDDIGEDSITIRRSVSNSDINATKTGKTRTVPLLAHVRKALNSYREEYPADGMNRVFYSELGGWVNRAYLHPHITAICAAAGLPRVSPHDARRTVNNLVRQTAGIIVAQSLTGHVTQEMTAHYSSVTVDETKGALLKALPAPPKGKGRRG